MKDQLCRAFCDNLQVREVPAGMAVSTPFLTADGDRIGFYIAKQSEPNIYRIEDDGTALPMMESNGLDFSSGTRGDAMAELLTEYGVIIDEETREFAIENIAETQVAAAAMRFVAFSLRVRDFALMTEARVIGSFRDDVAKLLRQVIGDRAVVSEREPVVPRLADFLADFVVRAPNRPPVGVFLGMSNQRVLEAVVVQMRATYETRDPCSIIALLERGQSITAPVRRQAANRLNAVTEFRGDEIAAINRIVYEALGQTLH
jgi:hypothetical protein